MMAGGKKAGQCTHAGVRFKSQRAATTKVINSTAKKIVKNRICR